MRKAPAGSGPLNVSSPTIVRSLDPRAAAEHARLRDEAVGRRERAGLVGQVHLRDAARGIRDDPRAAIGAGRRFGERRLRRERQRRPDDGAGNPRGIAGEDIPRLSRMISIADTYDVMTARDSYREPGVLLRGNSGATARCRSAARRAIRQSFRGTGVGGQGPRASATARTPTSTSSLRSKSELPRWSKGLDSSLVLTRTAATGSTRTATSPSA